MKAACHCLVISVRAVISYLLPFSWGHGKGNNNHPRLGNARGGGAGRGGARRGQGGLGGVEGAVLESTIKVDVRSFINRFFAGVVCRSQFPVVRHQHWK